MLRGMVKKLFEKSGIIGRYDAIETSDMMTLRTFPNVVHLRSYKRTCSSIRELVVESGLGIDKKK